MFKQVLQSSGSNQSLYTLIYSRPDAESPVCCAIHRDSGKIAKTLTLQRFDQGQDWYLQLSVKDNGSKENSITLGLPITGPELFTLKTLAEVISGISNCCISPMSGPMCLALPAGIHDHACPATTCSLMLVH